MSSRKQALRQEDSSPTPVESTPKTVGYGHPEYHFVTGLMSLQTQMGEVKAALETLTKSVDSTKSKVDDLVAWKNRILGGAVALGVICTGIGWGVTKLSSYVEFKNPNAVQAAPNAETPAEDQNAKTRPTMQARSNTGIPNSNQHGRK